MHSRSPDLEKRSRWVAGCFFAGPAPPAEGAVPKRTGVTRSLDARPQVSILSTSKRANRPAVAPLTAHSPAPAPTTLLCKAAVWIEGEVVLEGAPGYSRDP